MKNYKNTIFAFFFLSVVLYAQPSYDVSLYGKVGFCKITMGEKIVISPTKTGEMFFEQLKYSQEDFNENSLLRFLLSKTLYGKKTLHW